MLATELPAVVACRCSPTQKADVAKLIREFSKKTVCCIGDGGNDVSMIQAADVGESSTGVIGTDPPGIGIVGKEGKQASLAADFSINQFSYLAKLLLWHGRNSYQRSAKLSQFVIHRGLIISVIQAVFSSIFFFARRSIDVVSANALSDSVVSRLATGWIRYSLHHGAGILVSAG